MSVFSLVLKDSGWIHCAGSMHGQTLQNIVKEFIYTFIIFCKCTSSCLVLLVELETILTIIVQGK